ncbi:MAG: GNAT family N-acetyltransferase [bacterium]
MTNLRCMQDSDLSKVNLILSKAFTHAFIQEGFTSNRVPLCRLEYLRMYLTANPEGCFVIEKNGKLIAYCFSHLWGLLGWIGPLSVIPAEEGKGYGKRIVAAGMDYLEQRGAKTIGLETSSRSNRNLAFYTRIGFLPGPLTVDMFKPISAVGPEGYWQEYEALYYSRLDSNQRQSFKARLQEMADKLQPGLDYSTEIEQTCQYGFGDACLLLRKQETVAFVLAHTEPYSTEEARKFLKVIALQVAPNRALEKLGVTLNWLEVWARNQSLSNLYVRVPTHYLAVFDYLLAHDFKIFNIDLRMTLRGFPQDDDPNQVNLSKWQ